MRIVEDIAIGVGVFAAALLIIFIAALFAMSKDDPRKP